MREFLAPFAIPPIVHETGEIPCEIKNDDVIRGFRSWRETTSTSPSGRHLGLYKAEIQHPVLLSCFEKFMNISVMSGISIPRWSNAINVLIEKDAGHPKINRLQIIHLFEADFNFFLKLQWGHRLVCRAISLHLLHDGQHGWITSGTYGTRSNNAHSLSLRRTYVGCSSATMQGSTTTRRPATIASLPVWEC